MPRYSAGAKSGAGSTTLPLLSLYAAAAVGAKMRECGVFNTTNVAVDVKLTRITTAGTQGSGLTEAKRWPKEDASPRPGAARPRPSGARRSDRNRRGYSGPRGGGPASAASRRPPAPGIPGAD